MKVHLVYLTYNRLAYTRMSLPSLLADPSEEFDLTIWDNGSTDGTADYLKNEVRDRRIVEVVYSPKNVGQVAAVNDVWGRSRADLFGKCDNDRLVTPGWTRTFAAAHEEIPELGAVCAWGFWPDDFDEERAMHKIQAFGRHRIFRQVCIDGSCVLFKRSAYLALGPMEPPSTSAYWLKMARAGYVLGFYYPLVYQEHMDDPKSDHSVIVDEASYQEAKKVTFIINCPGRETLPDFWRWRGEVLQDLHDNPFDLRSYQGWRLRALRIRNRLKHRFGFNPPRPEWTRRTGCGMWDGNRGG